MKKQFCRGDQMVSNHLDFVYHFVSTDTTESVFDNLC